MAAKNSALPLKIIYILNTLKQNTISQYHCFYYILVF